MREKLAKNHVKDGEEIIKGKEEAFLDILLIYYIKTLFLS